jgi:hypothetical protein
MTCIRCLPLFAALAILAFVAAAPEASHASEHAAAQKPDEKEEDAEDPALPQRLDMLDLGEFNIRNTLTAHHTTVDIKFGLFLILSSTTTPDDYERLEHWKNRLRDQAIVAVRSAEPEDFADPKLVRVRRLVLLRIRRLPAPAKIIGAYLTDFAVDKNE